MLGACALAALWGVPAALRVTGVPWAVRFALIGFGAFTLAPIILAQRTVAREPPGHAVFWGLLASAGPLWGLATIIHQGTHHRPLGAVTLVFLGAVVVLGATLIAHRLLSRSEPWRRAFKVGAGLSAAWTVWHLRGSPPWLGPSLIDGAWGVVLLVVATTAQWERALQGTMRVLPVGAAVTLWGAVGVTSAALLWGSLADIVPRAPLILALLSWS